MAGIGGNIKDIPHLNNYKHVLFSMMVMSKKNFALVKRRKEKREKK